MRVGPVELWRMGPTRPECADHRPLCPSALFTRARLIDRSRIDLFHGRQASGPRPASTGAGFVWCPAPDRDRGMVTEHLGPPARALAYRLLCAHQRGVPSVAAACPSPPQQQARLRRPAVVQPRAVSRAAVDAEEKSRPAILRQLQRRLRARSLRRLRRARDAAPAPWFDPLRNIRSPFTETDPICACRRDESPVRTVRRMAEASSIDPRPRTTDTSWQRFAVRSAHGHHRSGWSMGHGPLDVGFSPARERLGQLVIDPAPTDGGARSRCGLSTVRRFARRTTTAPLRAVRVRDRSNGRKSRIRQLARSTRRAPDGHKGPPGFHDGSKRVPSVWNTPGEVCAWRTCRSGRPRTSLRRPGAWCSRCAPDLLGWISKRVAARKKSSPSVSPRYAPSSHTSPW